LRRRVGARFAIREGGKTVGSGVVTKVVAQVTWERSWFERSDQERLSGKLFIG